MLISYEFIFKRAIFNIQSKKRLVFIHGMTKRLEKTGLIQLVTNLL
jgi:hypothetical protein